MCGEGDSAGSETPPGLPRHARSPLRNAHPSPGTGRWEQPMRPRRRGGRTTQLQRLVRRRRIRRRPRGRFQDVTNERATLRRGSVRSVQHPQKNPGQAARGVSWKPLPDGSDRVSGRSLGVAVRSSQRRQRPVGPFTTFISLNVDKLHAAPRHTHKRPGDVSDLGVMGAHGPGAAFWTPGVALAGVGVGVVFDFVIPGLDVVARRAVSVEDTHTHTEEQ